MKRLLFLKVLLILQTLAMLTYTFIALKQEGASLFYVFLSNIQELSWNGQFNLDFSCYLLLSGIWIMWRNKFAAPYILFGIVAAIAGIIVFAPYLLWLLVAEKGNLKRVLMGDRL
ncbi:MAG: hypothetical protein NTW29_07670 [Bacteroidetes bacterium]|nr:hypothetical protein [Bacteroidota bacterium]